jgi:hypothetical protein
MTNSHKKFNLIRPLAMTSVFSLAIVPMIAFSAVSSDTNIYGLAGSSNPMNEVTNSGVLTSLATTSYSQPYLGKPQYGDGTASVNQGVINLTSNTFAGSSVQGTYYPVVYGETFSRGSWADSIMITPTDLGLVGQSGILYGSLHRIGTVSLGVSGGGGLDQPGASANVYALTVPTKYFFPQTANFNNQSLDNVSRFSQSGQSVTEDIPFELSFIFGSDTVLGYSLFSTVNAGSGNLGWGSASANYSLGWNGISSVTNATGAAVNYTIASQSGLNYQLASPVPVPAAIWLFGSAFVGFIGFNRRKTI